MNNLTKGQLRRLTTFNTVTVCTKQNDQMSSSNLFTLTAEMTHFFICNNQLHAAVSS